MTHNTAWIAQQWQHNVWELYKGPATRNDFVNDIVNDARADAIFATLKAIVDDEKSTISCGMDLSLSEANIVLFLPHTVCESYYSVGTLLSFHLTYQT